MKLNLSGSGFFAKSSDKRIIFRCLEEAFLNIKTLYTAVMNTYRWVEDKYVTDLKSHICVNIIVILQAIS